MYYIPLGIMRGEKPNETSMERVISKDWYWTDPSYALNISIPFDEIKTVEIDPSLRIADVNRKNNTVYNK